VEVKLTGKPDEAVADNVTGPALSGILLRGAKVIVCGVPAPQAVNVLPATVVVLGPLTKFGSTDVTPIGAKLTVAVIAAAEGVTAPGFATRYTGIVKTSSMP
jgi:hypothetical protein